jgi:lipid-A-disaccharide synthase
MTRYFIFAGEASGDLHGARLMQAIHLTAESFFEGVGGPDMRKNGLSCFLPMECFQVMGFSDVCKQLPQLCKFFYQTRDHILKTSPDCVILIDYPGFNLRLARSLRRKKFRGKIIQYICPSIWAHGKKRIKILEASVDLLLTILPFEKKYFLPSSLKVSYVGHPLLETVQTHVYKEDWREQECIPVGPPLIGLFPGSRMAELKRHLPLQVNAALQLKNKFPSLVLAVACAQESLRDYLLCYLEKESLQGIVHIVSPSFRYEFMRDCHTALAKSGTVTLELALHQIPTVVHYKLSTLNSLIAHYFLRLRLPYFCLVNILINQEVYPEWIKIPATSFILSQSLEKIYLDSFQREKIVQTCIQLKQKLHPLFAHQNAADAIRELMTC